MEVEVHIADLSVLDVAMKSGKQTDTHTHTHKQTAEYSEDYFSYI
jgi:hypothetical protein